MKNKLVTKFGTSKINSNGYWEITSRKEGNNGKTLHRLIYEDYYGCTLLLNVDIHHIDGNPLNNNISNLKLLSRSEHMKIHKNGENHHMYGKQHTDETKLQISLSISKAKNTTGIKHLTTRKKNNGQGFLWRYVIKDKIDVCSVSLDKLKQKVLNKGYLWEEI